MYLWQVHIFLNSLPRWQLFKFLGFLCVFCAHYFRLLDVSRQFSIVVGGPSLLLVDSDSDAVMGDFGLTRQLETKNHLQMHQISGQEIHLSQAKTILFKLQKFIWGSEEHHHFKWALFIHTVLFWWMFKIYVINITLCSIEFTVKGNQPRFSEVKSFEQKTRLCNFFPN